VWIICSGEMGGRKEGSFISAGTYFWLARAGIPCISPVCTVRGRAGEIDGYYYYSLGGVLLVKNSQCRSTNVSIAAFVLGWESVVYKSEWRLPNSIN